MSEARMRRGFLSSVDAEQPSSYLGSALITLDTDWANDGVLEDTANLLRVHGARSTWFITHDSPFIREISSDDDFEMGIHPNFRNILNNSATCSVEDEFERLLTIVPTARSWRSHGVIQGGDLAELARSYGLTHDSNDLVPFAAARGLRPWRTVTGLIKVPFRWVDEHAWEPWNQNDYRDYLALEDLFVVNFHPIHIFLNTSRGKTYQLAKPFSASVKHLLEYREKGFGSRAMFTELLEHIKHSQASSLKGRLADDTTLK
jgi:hypothetical protein